MNTHVLVAGCGDVGLRVAKRLRGRGDAVTGLRRSAQALPDGIDTCTADLTDASTLGDLAAGITDVVYLPTPDARTPEAYEAVYRTGLGNLLQALDTARLRRVVFVSSSAVYGDHGGDWVDEDTPCDPPGFNGEILLRAEQWLAAQAVPSVVLRLSGLYGPGRTRLFERLRGGEVSVPRHPAFWGNRIHVDDAAAAIVHLLDIEEPAGHYLGTDNTPLPLADLYDHLAGLLDAPVPTEGPAPRGIGNKRLSNQRLRATGFVPRWPDCRGGYAALLAVPAQSAD